MVRVVVALFVLGLLTGVASAAPVPKALKKKPLRAKIEPLPGEKVYTAEFDDVPTDKVFEWVEMQTGLMFISKDKPNSNITLHAEKVCMPELFAQLDDLLYPQGFVLARKTVSFSSIPVKDLASYRQHFPLVGQDELNRWSMYAPVQVLVEVDAKGLKTAKALAHGMKDDGFQVLEKDADKLIVLGRATDVRKFVDDMGDQIKK
jgi:hypothetical protein